MKDITSFISKGSKHFAKTEVLKIKRRTVILKSFMLSGRIVPEIDRKEIRELIQGNYRIIYKIISKNQIDILTIHHSSRSLNV